MSCTALLLLEFDIETMENVFSMVYWSIETIFFFLSQQFHRMKNQDKIT